MKTRARNDIESGFDLPELSALCGDLEAETSNESAWQSVEFVHPSDSEAIVANKTLEETSMALADLFSETHIDKEAIGSVKAMVAFPGDLLGRVADSGQTTPSLPGPHVGLTPAMEYRAERFGYVSLHETNGLSIISPLWMDAERMHVYWLVLDGSSYSVRPDMVQAWLDELGVVDGVDETKIADLARSMESGVHKRGMYLIARGREPEPGAASHTQIEIDIERHAGKMRADGSMDFHEINFSPNARPGQLVAWRTSAKPGTGGIDLLGNPVPPPAPAGNEETLRAGGNIEVRQADTLEEYFAKVAGLVKLEDGTLSVTEILNINGDVDFHTGNLKFAGEVFVRGSITRGFSVKSGSDVTVGETIEPGASVSSRGNVTVGQGIVGRKTQVVAAHSIRAQHVQEASLTAGKDISVGSFAYHAKMRAAGKVVIARKAGDETNRSGSIMGGQTRGRKGIETHVVGTMNGMPSILVAGLNPEQAKEIDRLQRSITASTVQIERILDRFELPMIDLTQIRNLIKAATGPNRKLLARRARQLGELAQNHQKLLTR